MIHYSGFWFGLSLVSAGLFFLGMLTVGPWRRRK